MADEKSGTVTDEKTVNSILVPTEQQVLKTSDEILSELFGAFDATPPPLDDLQTLETNSTISDKSHKKHKKHSKKKHKKEKKKKKRSSSSDSKGSKESKKKSSKKHKKHSKCHNSESDVNSKKKKRKLGKFSASDSDSDVEEPSNKKLKSASKDKLTIEEKLLNIKVKDENDTKKTKLNGTTTVPTVPEVIRENILKEAVSKIVDKVIKSTDLASEIRKSINGSKITPINSDSDVVENEIYSLGLPKQIKQEPKEEQSSKTTAEKLSEVVQQIEKPLEKDKVTVEAQEPSTLEKPNKPLPVADVFAEDLIDCGIKKDDLKPNTDKQKHTGSKIKIPNLKFSQVYEATVKQIEEEAKLKAEKYEEGELSESSEEERSPTPSDLSSSGSIEEIKKSEDVKKKKRSHHRRHHKHHQSSHRSRSVEKHRSHSHSEQSHSSHHHRDEKKDKLRDREKRRSRDRDVSKGRDKIRCREKNSRDRTKERSRSRDRIKDKARSRSRSRGRHRSRSRSKDRTKIEAKTRSRSRDKKTKERERSKERDRSRDREGRRHVKTRAHSREREKRSPEEKIDKQKLLEIARKNALHMLKNPGGTVDQTKLAITSGGKTVNELTDFCKLLSKKDADGHESISSNTSGDESESEKPFHHPFQIKDRPSSIVLNIRNSVALPVKSLQEKAAEQSRQLRLQFPVSSGQQHRKTESEWIPVSPKKADPPSSTQVALVKPNTKRVFKDPPPKPDMDIGSIVSQRLEAMRRLQENPSDSSALSQMQSAQQHMQSWAESKQLPPGQFTGSTGVKVLSQAELSSGYQAWARRASRLQRILPTVS
ncbi:protein SON-like isoform X2 [Macrosteles quadrilineatus]|uniref:protein SON-like isoform X2 n=1 Tax=Macrosteles quadrilineatus TaxID=74068 RepID=UPI0023E27CFB|nr:protein SON-like isoform X2 [Macrosteles quadrilineatus]